MGIEINALRALGFAKRIKGANFERTAMIGRQEIFFTEEDFAFIKKRVGLPLDYDRSIGIGQFAEALFKKFGARSVDAIDASDYEGANVITDLNKPIREELRGRYTLCADFGSIEHIFNIPQVIDNIFALLVEGGTVIVQSQANGFAGHGFYQLSPELFYTAFSRENGFTDTTVFLVDMQDIRRWYFIRDPHALARRNDIAQRRSYYIFCIARKRASVAGVQALQSDYQLAWTTEGHSHMGAFGRGLSSRVRHLFNPFLFQNIRGLYYALRSLHDFRRETLRFDPDLISGEDFDRLVAAAAGGRSAGPAYNRAVTAPIAQVD